MFSPSTMPRLSPAQADILNDLPGRIAHVSPRRPFREPLALLDEVVLVRKGLLSLYREDGVGRRQIVALRYPGEGIVPPASPPFFGVQAIVQTEVLLCAVEAFNGYLAHHAELQNLLSQRAERHTAISYEWLVNNGRRDTTARVAHFLCEAALRTHPESASEGLTSPFTQQHIADVTGQTPVNVNRVLGDLERQGLIKRKGRRIDFLDWAELQRAGSFQAAYLQ